MGRDDDDDDDVMSDLVAYLVIQVADRDSLASIGPALDELASSSTIRVLDVAAVTIDDLGGVHELSLDGVLDVDGIAASVLVQGQLLSEHDIRLAALVLPPGSAGMVLVTEDRWASKLASAARSVGGRIVAGERIPPHRVERALVQVDDHEGGLT